MYKVIYSDKTIKQLKKLDKYTRDIILSWIEKNLLHCQNPRTHGKSLVGNKSGQWRYRVGNYRILAEIQDEEIVILVLSVGHRKSIYKK